MSSFKVKKVAVIGSGVMGSGIAAHFANIGIPCLLLDIVPRNLTAAEEKLGLTLEDKQVRNRIVQEAKHKLLKQKPAPLATKSKIDLISVGNLEDDLESLSEVDWIIEVVLENLQVKKQVFEKVDQYRKEGTIISSNTSGISVHAMAEDRSTDFQEHFLGTHFFNPPRYLKLLEIIPTKHTKPEVITFLREFGENVLGKGVVEAKDTPNFIANRIGTYGLLVTVREMLRGGFSVGEVDSVTGPLIGRPKSATFRTLDVVGLDTFIHVANNVHEQVEGEEREVFKVPEFMLTMQEKGWIGSKAGQGFFHKTKVNGKSEILELDPETMTYGPRKKLQSAAIEMAKQVKGTKAKMKALIYSDDPAGKLLWSIFKPVLLFSAERAYEIADNIHAIDQAMKWGFGWELGPFEVWDAIGLEDSINKMKQEGDQIPNWVEQMLIAGNTSFYQNEKSGTSYFHHNEYVTISENKKRIHLKRLKDGEAVIKKNTGASLIDMGDGVALLEFHSQSNAIGQDIMQMVHWSIDEVEKNYEGLVIGNQGKNFCVGANLALILMEAQDDNFFELDMVVRQFQQMTSKIRYSKKPVVVAPFAMTLGGGAEVSLPAAKIQASLETYMGLVEVGVGLIPGGGGNHALYRKHLERLEGTEVDLQKVANKVFETIAMAKVSTSAYEAIENGFLTQKDTVSINGDHLISDAKAAVLELVKQEYQSPQRKKIPVVGEAGYAQMLLGAQTMRFGNQISDHDLKIAKKLAFVIAGGKVKEGSLVDEQYLLDLEREAFLSLLGEPKTQARMQYMLLKGKPLRN